jgi:hypothetical protein
MRRWEASAGAWAATSAGVLTPLLMTTCWTLLQSGGGEGLGVCNLFAYENEMEARDSL